jgi:hypothetical protein
LPKIAKVKIAKVKIAKLLFFSAFSAYSAMKGLLLAATQHYDTTEQLALFSSSAQVICWAADVPSEVTTPHQVFCS